MSKTLGIAVAFASVTWATVAAADVNIYGKAYVSFEAVEEGETSTTELVSNASRLGFKGSEIVSDGVEVIYQLEYEAYFDDTRTFKQRNIFVGVKGDLGQVIGGYFDTPFKTLQNKTDLFNDLRGDIKHIVTPHENRASNTIEYTTPNTLGGFKAEVALVNSEVDDVDNGTSVALSWAGEHLYVGGAMDQDIEAQGVDAMRVVMQYNRGAWQLGALYEETDIAVVDNITAYMVSLQYKLEQNWVFKVQHGGADVGERNDILFENGKTTSIGADYILSKTTKVFGFYTAETADDDTVDNSYAGIGVELKF